MGKRRGGDDASNVGPTSLTQAWRASVGTSASKRRAMAESVRRGARRLQAHEQRHSPVPTVMRSTETGADGRSPRSARARRRVGRRVRPKTESPASRRRRGACGPTRATQPSERRRSGALGCVGYPLGVGCVRVGRRGVGYLARRGRRGVWRLSGGGSRDKSVTPPDPAGLAVAPPRGVDQRTRQPRQIVSERVPPAELAVHDREHLTGEREAVMPRAFKIAEGEIDGFSRSRRARSRKRPPR